LLLFYDALKSSHITFILFYYNKVEKVTVENVGTYVVGFWGGGELLVPSDHDETGGVAKVDVSNIMNQSLYLFSLHTSILPTSLPHMYNCDASLP